ncbi:SDR family NAD(P)-dependent oxidoreductase [Flammeovirga aprica]|uniref:SDR family NAD(P)-dependent oxidoreductase n=1 Tax=Flammeovirga aprica JL-4 TaxID=694437 RepID=A0A7X9S136_9BACT|nr:SDR family NAD(P)-dependent oxidoreductase [Flammeovirga aprica]NME72465.1 SDR family NAD(P)-dependent oxidoreductase [Flammeovirga aprica JL-4]
MKKTILITGSTDGIGKLVALKLAKEGHSVFIHGRNPFKVKSAIEEIQKQSHNENVDGFVGDLSEIDQVEQLSADILQKLHQIDVLINNAGVFKSPEPTNSQGLDLRFMVNYLAPYLLTEKLLPIIKGEDARIINLSSAAQSPVSLLALEGKESLTENTTYAQSKLALTMWSFDLSKKVNDITVIAVNPGSLLNTRMVKEAYGKHWSSADKGGSILYELATTEEHKNHNGEYFDNDAGHYGRAHSDAYDSSKIEALLSTTKTLLSTKPKINDN